MLTVSFQANLSGIFIESKVSTLRPPEIYTFTSTYFVNEKKIIKIQVTVAQFSYCLAKPLLIYSILKAAGTRPDPFLLVFLIPKPALWPFRPKLHNHKKYDGFTFDLL